MPEIADGIVEIKACAREPGHRTKIAVWSNDHNVDPVGACVGARGGRVRMVVNELRGEKIDIVPFSEDLADFVAKALSPAKVSQVIISEDGTQADVIVPDHQLSLAIGREGQNARLVGPPHRRARRHPFRDAARRGHAVRRYREAEVEYADGEWIANAETGEMEWHAADGSVVSQAEWVEQLGGGTPEVASPESTSSDAKVDEAKVATRLSPRWTRPRSKVTARPLPRRARPPREMARHSDAEGPIRTCIGCRTRRPPAELVRCVLGTDGVARVDRHGAGRGAWLCGPQCLELAVRRRAFDRAWRTSVGAEQLVQLRLQLQDGSAGSRCET